MSLHFWHPDLKTQVENIVSTCNPCQRYKQVLRGHGHTAGREAATHPWRNVAVDLIGPWTLVIQGSEVEFRALTIIDMVTNLAETVRIENKTASNVAQHFVNSWLSRYPRPMSCIYDPGHEFTGYHFQ
jgi:hypothetical protein